VRQAVYTMMIGASLLVGCVDEQAANRRAVRKQFMEVMKLIATADQGYVPNGQEIEIQLTVGNKQITETRSDLQAFRQQVLTDSAKQLQEILEIGSPSQTTSARRVLGDVYASQARYSLLQAMTSWAALADQSASLISYLESVDWADSRVRRFDTDERPLLTEYQKDQQAYQGKIKDFAQQITQLGHQIRKLNDKIETLNNKSEEAAQKAQALQGLALVTTDGDKQYNLYNQASTADRKANIASTTALKLGVLLDIQNSELALLVKRHLIAQDAIKTLDKQIAAAKKRQGRLPYKQALSQKTQAITKLIAVLNQITSDYTSLVENRLEFAAEKMNDAMDQIDLPNSGQVDRLAQIEQLGRMCDMTHVLTEHVLVSGSHGKTLAVIASQTNRLIPDQAAMTMDMAQQMYVKQKDLIQLVKQIISDATASCNQLSRGLADSDPRAQLPKEQMQRLESYRRQIDKQRLPPPKIG